MQSRLPQIKALGAEVLAISVDTPEESRRLAKSAGLEFSILSDPEGKVIDAYGLRHPQGSIDGGDIARPAVFVMDKQGRIAWRVLTDNWRVRVHPETVLEQLRRMP